MRRVLSVRGWHNKERGGGWGWGSCQSLCLFKAAGARTVSRLRWRCEKLTSSVSLSARTLMRPSLVSSRFLRPANYFVSSVSRSSSLAMLCPHTAVKRKPREGSALSTHSCKEEAKAGLCPRLPIPRAASGIQSRIIFHAKSPKSGLYIFLAL